MPTTINVIYSISLYSTDYRFTVPHVAYLEQVRVLISSAVVVHIPDNWVVWSTSEALAPSMVLVSHDVRYEATIISERVYSSIVTLVELAV